MTTKLLEIEGLTVDVNGSDGKIRILDDVNIGLGEGETLGIVGESGSGKSTLAGAIPRLLARGLTVSAGQIRLSGEDIIKMSPARLRQMRGAEVATILQDPLHSLTPWLKIGVQVAEPSVVHDRLSWKDAKKRALHLLRSVWIPEPEGRLEAYPHEMSGGMRQRVAGAVALACAPRLFDRRRADNRARSDDPAAISRSAKIAATRIRLCTDPDHA